MLPTHHTSTLLGSTVKKSLVNHGLCAIEVRCDELPDAIEHHGRSTGPVEDTAIREFAALSKALQLLRL